MRAVVVGVGSNLGAREAAIHAARYLLHAREGIEVSAVSPIYETEPLGPPQPRYLNAAFRLQTEHSPTELLSLLLRTERRLGRRRHADQRWGPRSIDLDLLWDERGPHESPSLCVPHRELLKRDFALAPLLDVAPELVATFGQSLERLGGAPSRWTRDARVVAETSRRGFEVDVEADSLADACALSLAHGVCIGRPWSSLHMSVEPDAEAFARTVRDVSKRGFSIHRVSISHCAKSQWGVEFHGACMGNARLTDVRLWTTPASHRQIRLRLAVRY
ncbi:MAG: 2-amino-4-hydroxy-6-hydroxymethyldihydropteridine diphosphokinase [Myxococcales bacterium]|nr:2-amino-4-hydroxy-6-hydroxymethyldihydropteridine diphosphokinase [Deltaproteobacteria bacterium]NNL25934.1 2-amino-4-hydroxy-6-hydroxymethyldihydropteridine diphosphokinase [Myxococcales bacterium]